MIFDDYSLDGFYDEMFDAEGRPRPGAGAVVDRFRERGVVFVEELDEVPSDSVVVFSAHGVSPEVRNRAKARGCTMIDATCPLVTKVHSEAKKYARLGYHILLIGDSTQHQEVIGTRGERLGAMRQHGEREVLEGQIAGPVVAHQPATVFDENGTILARRGDTFTGSWSLDGTTWQPLGEPVVGHGPFVMSSEAEIRAAIDDFNSGRFGQMPH